MSHEHMGEVQDTDSARLPQCGLRTFMLLLPTCYVLPQTRRQTETDRLSPWSLPDPGLTLPHYFTLQHKTFSRDVTEVLILLKVGLGSFNYPILTQ